MLILMRKGCLNDEITQAISNLLKRGQSWVNGQWVDARSGKTITVTNPVDGSTLGNVCRHYPPQETRQRHRCGGKGAWTAGGG